MIYRFSFNFLSNPVAQSPFYVTHCGGKMQDPYMYVKGKLFYALKENRCLKTGTQKDVP